MSALRQLGMNAVHGFKGQMPSVISARCGNCSKRERFRIEDWSSHRDFRFVSSPCPDCRTAVTFIVSGFTDEKKKLGGGELFMSPCAVEWNLRPEMMDALQVNREIQRDYESGAHAFDDRNPLGIVSAARRLLEGMVVQFIPPEERKRSLAPNLERLHDFHNLTGVLRGISEAVKDAGNLGVHYGASRLTNEIAAKCWVLSHELLSMHFLLERRVDELRNLVDAARASTLEDVPDNCQPSNSG